MMNYVCIEKEKIVSILNYQPNVPSEVEVIEISDDQFSLINLQTHYFDIATRSVLPIPQEEEEKRQREKQNVEPKEFLNSTDWMILRHMRQKTLGVPTTLLEQEFLELEQQRNDAAARIK
jgi:hypothetical protein